MTPKLDLPHGFELLQTGRCRAVVRSSVKDQVQALHLTDRRRVNELLSSGTPLAGGRGSAVSVPFDDGRAVLRLGRRGGPAGALLGDWYVLGRRPVDELRAAEAARSAGVSVPEYLAAFVWRSGPVYTGAVVVRELAGAKPLAAWLAPPEAPGDTELRAMADVLAKAFRALFRAGIYHRDLHGGNVLVRPGDGRPEVAIIDFDRAKRLPALPDRLRDRMLFRFNRALVKRALAPRPVSLRRRVRFCKELDVAPDRAGLRRFVAACGAHLRRHAWHYRPGQE
jgi:tRNA A-37 threonylcarbamoyl transferase component Bud32